MPENPATRPGSDRRAFLASAGKFAVVTPPLMTLLLSTSLTSPAIAASGTATVRGPTTGGSGPDCDDGKRGHDNDGQHFGWFKNRRED